MILGRNTAQWTGFITALTGFLGIIVPVLAPGLDATQVSVVLGATTIFLGAFIAFLANDALTPVNDPRLAIGSVVNAGQPNQGVVKPSNAEVADVIKVPAQVEVRP
jgi:hypothetical protein